MDGKIRFGIDFGTDSLKFTFAGVPDGKDSPVYGKIARSFFEPHYAGLGYYNQKTDEWIFGNEIFDENLDTFETIVEVKQLLNLLYGNADARRYDTSHIFPKYGQEIGRAARDDYRPTFECPSDTPKTVVEKFFARAVADFFNPALEELTARFADRGYEYARECVATYPYDADDRYKLELKRLIETTGFKVLKMMPEPVAAGLYAYVLNPTALLGRHAVLVDIGASRTSAALIEFLESGVETVRFFPSLGVGGLDYDRAVADYARRTSGRGEPLSAMQQYRLNRRAKSAKEYLGVAERTIVEYDSEVTVHVPLSREVFERESADVTDKIRRSVAAALQESPGAGHLILTGGCGQTVGLADAVRQAGVTLVNPEYAASSEPEVYEAVGCENVFAAALGAALASTGAYLTKSVAPLSYGVEAYSANVVCMCTMVHKNTPIPFKRTDTFSVRTTGNDARVNLLSSDRAGDHIALRYTTTLIDQKLEFKRTVYPGHPIYVSVSIDESGIGRVTVLSPNAARDLHSEFELPK